MVSKDPPQVDITKKSRRRRRRAGSRAARRRSRKISVVAAVVATQDLSPAKCAVHAFLMRYQSALRKVPTHLPPRVHAGPPSKRVKRVSWRKFYFIFNRLQ